MKTEEDEAFEDIERRQGGFQAKRKMAANKLWDRPSVAFDEWWNNDNDESTNPFRLESGAYWAWAGWKAALAQPAQEPVAWMHPSGGVLQKLATGLERSTYTIPLYTTPPKREWVGLTDEDEIPWDGVDAKSFARAIEAKLKEKNFD
jgi:hypothetical protein